jgi:hypothetical protein
MSKLISIGKRLTGVVPKHENPKQFREFRRLYQDPKSFSSLNEYLRTLNCFIHHIDQDERTELVERYKISQSAGSGVTGQIMADLSDPESADDLDDEIVRVLVGDMTPEPARRLVCVK